MHWYSVLAASLVTTARAFAPAPIQWEGLPARKFVLTPQAIPGRALVPPQNLMIKDGLYPTSPAAVPQFTAQLDQTITWNDQKHPSVRWCIEASGSLVGDVVRINHCTGGPSQKWNWVPNEHGQNMIQLYGSNKCLHVADSKTGFLHAGSVDLHECGNPMTEVWNFEETRSSPVDGSFQRLAYALPMRHMTACLFSILALGTLSVGAWLHRKEAKNKARAVVRVGGATSRDTHQSGVSFTLPFQSGRPVVSAARPTVMALSPVPSSVDDGVRDDGEVIPSSSYLNQERAIQVDVDLMSQEGGFSIDQLMELAGLSVASAVAKEYPLGTHPQVLIICGPGNNGGDGLVAARHLHHFGYKPKVVYPKMEKIIANNDLYRRLTVQLAQLGIPVTAEWQIPDSGTTDVIIDAIFGFSFKGWRGGGKDAPFDDIVDYLSTEEGDRAVSSAPLVSVDIPSGWDVEQGPPDGKALRPDMLISLTAPKQCARLFRGKFHFLGGRFVPPSIVAKNKLCLPVYPGAEQCVRLAKT